jgi:hypothetical protein
MLIVPYYYFPEHVGKRYETEMAREFGCPAFSWSGFHHETSGVDFSVFRKELRKYRDRLEGVYNFPYMDFAEEDYLTWFHDAETPVGDSRCLAVEKWIDIQPGGEANSCVDFPDYSIGNVRDATIKEMWNGEKAVRFREYRKVPWACQVHTSKRELENYVHPGVITAKVPGYDGPAAVGASHDDADIPQLVARAKGVKPRRAKQWINTLLIADMTPELLTEVDPAGDLRGWLQDIGSILEG